MSEVIRSFDHPVLSNCRTLTVDLVTLRSPLKWRRALWRIRRHPEYYRRATGYEVVRPSYPVIVIDKVQKL
jgi:hypothetical protein